MALTVTSFITAINITTLSDLTQEIMCLTFTQSMTYVATQMSKTTRRYRQSELTVAQTCHKATDPPLTDPPTDL